MITFPDGRQFYSCPDTDPPEETLQAYLDYLNGAEKEVLICDYSFNLPQFTTILPTLKEKGVNVRLVLDRSQSKGNTEVPIIEQLQKDGFDIVIGTSSLHQIIHDKFTVRDEKDCQYGSWNYTVSASKEDNFFFIDPTPEVVTQLVKTWNSIRTWVEAHEPQS